MAILPIPSGTRDILPDEMRELSSIVGTLKGVFADAGFGEITTPALEYEEVLSRADIGARPAYRVVDDHGAVLVLRSDMTVPIARVVATRYATSDPPLRFCYVAPVYRAVRPHRGMSREFLQAGIELVGLPSPDGTAEALTVLCRALEATGLREFRIGLGDAALFPRLLDQAGVDGPARGRVCASWPRATSWGWSASSACCASTTRTRACCCASRACAAAPRCSTRSATSSATQSTACGASTSASRPRWRGGSSSISASPATSATTRARCSRCTTPGSAAPLGGGGRYDDLLGRFGRSLPAVGFALRIDDLHQALTARNAPCLS